MSGWQLAALVLNGVAAIVMVTAAVLMYLALRRLREANEIRRRSAAEEDKETADAPG